MAAGDGLLDVVKAFIERGDQTANSKDEFGYSAMHAAVSYGQAGILTYLLSVGGDVNIEDVDGGSWRLGRRIPRRSGLSSINNNKELSAC